MNWTPKQVSAFRLLSSPNAKRCALLGGSRSGKSFTIAHKIRQRAVEFPGVPQFILRKTMADARDTVWRQTILPVLKHDIDSGFCKVYKQPAMAEFTNGSFLRVGGLHPSEIDKVLGSEAGSSWVNEASEAAWQNIPAVLTRLNDRSTHRSHGGLIVPKLYVDFNPPTVKHWTYKAFIRKVDPVTEEPLKDAQLWQYLKMNPADNLPNLADGYIDTLESMSPRDRQRFLYGEFGQLSGLVYDNFDPEKHVYDSGQFDSMRLYRGIDFGFTHPFVCLWAYYDDANESLYVDDERYLARVTINAHAQGIMMQTASRQVYDSISDHDSGDRQVLQDAGIQTTAANKDVSAGINRVYDLFSRGKIKINRRCANLINELYSYQWKESSKRDEPIKENDHALDALRYLVMSIYEESPRPQFIKAR